MVVAVGGKKRLLEKHQCRLEDDSKMALEKKMTG
jgi:hypothetical protein